jgi:hypothetical protein
MHVITVTVSQSDHGMDQGCTGHGTDLKIAQLNNQVTRTTKHKGSEEYFLKSKKGAESVFSEKG